MALNILIVGAGICGPAFAMLIQKAKPATKITVVERHPTLRTSGQQLDLRNQGEEIARKMGLMDEIKAHCVEETGLEILDSKGKQMAFFGPTPTGQSQKALTAEFEIMRGDLVTVLYEASLKQNAQLKQDHADAGGLTYEFDKTITALAQSADGVDATFTDGTTRRFDLVVGADGQASRTRRLAFGQAASDASFRPLGVHGAYFSAPRVEGEAGNAKAYVSAEQQLLFTRTGGRPVTQFLLYTRKDMDKFDGVYQKPLESQRQVYAESFKNLGWQNRRILDGVRTADDFYAHEHGQIKLDSLCTERVALLGDAGYCPTAFTGQGVTACLIGAYVLAGELARAGNDVPAALKSFDVKMRPAVDEMQKLRGHLDLMFPSSRFGAWRLRRIAWAVSKLDRLPRPSRSKDNSNGADKERLKRWQVPEYPELNL